MKKWKKLWAVAFAAVMMLCLMLSGCVEREYARPSNRVFGDEVFVYNEAGIRIIIHNEFVVVDGNTYYARNNKIAKGTQIIGDKLYHFSEESGVMTAGDTVGDFTYTEQGYATSEFMQFQLSDKDYFLIGENVYEAISFGGNIFESDHDSDNSNNEVLPSVTCTIELYNHTFTVLSDENGDFLFECLPAVEFVIRFYLENYIDATYRAQVTDSVSGIRIVMDKNVANVLSGKVVQADADTNFSNNLPLGEAKITLERTSSTNQLFLETTSDANGNYSFPALTAGVYVLKIELEGYISITQTIQIRANQTTIQNAVLEAIPAPAEGEEQSTGGASGTIVNAQTGRAIAGLTVILRKGINNTTGKIICTVFTDEHGVYTLENLQPGNYTAQILDERELTGTEEEIAEKRFDSLPFTVKILPGEQIVNQNASTSNSEGLNPDSIRVVLTWGSVPADLDSHIYAGGFHVYYSNKTSRDNNITLDVDDTTSYGPETITVSSTQYTGNYTYYVHDYTNRSQSNSSALGNSGAIVKVYFGDTAGPAYTFYVPQGKGVAWKVFTYNKDTGEFIIHNELCNSLL